MTYIRKLQLKDYGACVRMLHNEWHFGERHSKTNGRLCGWIYFFDILSCSQGIYIYEKNKKVAGLVGFESYRLKPNLRMRFFSLLKNILFFHPAITDRESLRHYYETYKYVPDKFKIKENCELTIFITHKNFRGQGVGSALFRHIVSLVQSKKYKKMIISTDDSCNKTYYERHDCQCLLDLCVGDKGEGYEKGYVFAKDLQI